MKRTEMANVEQYPSYSIFALSKRQLRGEKGTYEEPQEKSGLK